MSGKGGVGKSMIMVLFFYFLKDDYLFVVVDVDVEVLNFGCFLV